jgi:hypothetical protein
MAYRNVWKRVPVLLVAALLALLLTACNGIPGISPVSEGSSGASGAPAPRVVVGEFVTGRSVDGEGCVTDLADDFTRGDAIYAGIINSEIAAGAQLFARLSRSTGIIEDTPLITADAEYTCATFEFQPSLSAEVFTSDRYTIQLFINGNPADRIDVNIS